MHSRPARFVVFCLLAAGCGGASAVSPAMLDAAKRRWPDSTQASLERGRVTFGKRCKECHPLPRPSGHSSDEWPKILVKMSKQAGLGAQEKEDVLRYLIAAREAAE